MAETSMPVSDNLGRILRGRAEKVETGRYIQPVIRGSNFYFVGFVMSTVFAVFSTLYVDATSQNGPVVWQAATVSFVSTIFAGILGGFIVTTTALWFAQDKVVLGRIGVYSSVDYDGNRAIYLHDNSSEDLGKNLEVFEISRHGQLMDIVFTGNGPVAVTPVIEQDEVEKLREEYRRTGVRPKTPDKVRFHAAVKNGTTYKLNADYKPTLLGNEYSEVPDGVRKFIHDRWPGLTAGCMVYMAWDRLPETKETETMHRVSGLEYEIANLKQEKHTLLKNNEGLLEVIEQNTSALGGENG